MNGRWKNVFIGDFMAVEGVVKTFLGGKCAWVMEGFGDELGTFYYGWN